MPGDPGEHVFAGDDLPGGPSYRLPSPATASASGVSGMSADAATAMFRSIAEASPNAVLAADPDGVMVWVNPAAQQLFGWSFEEMVGCPLTLITADDQHPAAEAARRVLDGHPVEPRVTRGRRRTGETFDMTIGYAVQRTPDGPVLGISVIVTDITHALRAQRQLTEALARMNARFDQAGHPQALLDLNGRFVAVNDATCALLRRPRERLIGREALDMLLPVDPVPAGERFRKMRRGELSSVTTEVVAVCGDGDRIPVLVDLSVVDDVHGRPTEVVLFAQDLAQVREAQRRLESQEAFFRALNRESTDVVVVTEASSRITYVSPSVTRVLGYRREDLLGRTGVDFLVPDDEDQGPGGLLETRRAPPGSSSRQLVRVRAADGTWRWLDGTTTNCLDDADINGMVTNLRDVTAEIEAQNALKASETRFRAIAQTAQEGILATTLDGTVMFANEKLADILQRPVEELYGRPVQELFDPSESSRVQDRLANRQGIGPEQYELSYPHPDGTRHILVVAASPLSNDDGSPMGSLGMVSDVTDARATEAELRHRALHDILTGLPNRALLVDRLTMAAARMQRDGGRGLAVLFLDLDHFKLVNDSRGHDAGDRLLVDVAARLLDAVRDSDTVARLGGDEFAVVCVDADAADAEAVAARIQHQLVTPFMLDGSHVYVSASIGIALAPPYAVSDLLRHADAAMYDAKAAGRSQVASFQGGADLASKRRLDITGALREALEEGTLTLGYQPFVDLERRTVLGLEALLRWEHPVLGPVPPQEVVHAAEASGLSFELDRAVIRAAGDDLVRLRSSGVVTEQVYVSVNISPRSAQQKRLDALVLEMLDATGLPASSLCLEITEHALMDHAEHAVGLLTRLAERGVRIAIDDFGTGYNSMVHLQRLPLHLLKIDRSFVQDIATRQDSLAIARSIVGLATAIGLDTVAEGVETEEQVVVLRELGCQVGQGYLWGRAVRAPDVAASLASWQDAIRT
jgi:diguanylate cyclase (GGDEF)-like protein/PAS domain S-box-containing protein